jgi:hypothetical protein
MTGTSFGIEALVGLRPEVVGKRMGVSNVNSSTDSLNPLGNKPVAAELSIPHEAASSKTTAVKFTIPPVDGG